VNRAADRVKIKALDRAEDLSSIDGEASSPHPKMTRPDGEPFVNWVKRSTHREYSKNQRLVAVILGGLFFWLAVPLGIVVGSSFFDSWFHLPRFVYGTANPLVALLFMVPGWLFANWTIKAQFSLGRGTPIPIMATQKLVIRKPYTYCRNPMNLGTAVYYVGVAIWVGSLSALALALIYPVGILTYVKVIEEKELEERFGPEYVEYKRATPFIIPHFRKRG
jgi:protein-S-isoprenylcysteine O-methyltransferase Ste14